MNDPISKRRFLRMKKIFFKSLIIQNQKACMDLNVSERKANFK